MDMPKVNIEKELFNRARKTAEQAGYSSLEEFVAHVLESAVTAEENDDNDPDVLDRIKGLGYIS